jgi:hypothetical protein
MIRKLTNAPLIYTDAVFYRSSRSSTPGLKTYKNIIGRSQWPSGLKSWECCRSFAEIAGSNSAGGIDVCLLRMLCVFRFRGILSSVVCLSVIAEPHIGGLGPLGLPAMEKKIYICI